MTARRICRFNKFIQVSEISAKLVCQEWPAGVPGIGKGCFDVST